MAEQKKTFTKGRLLRFVPIIFMLTLIMAEMAYDGDFILAKNAPSAALRSACVKSFRLHFFEGTFVEDLTPIASELLSKGMSVEEAKLILNDNNYKVFDVTSSYRNAKEKYARDKFQGSDQALGALRNPDYFLLPTALTSVWSKQFCEVTIFAKDQKVTQVTARAVRASY
jgi:hypothetical protein